MAEQGSLKSPDGMWRAPNDKPVLPASTATTVLLEAESLSHCGERDMIRRMNRWWHRFMPHLISHIIASCDTCQTFNVKPTIKPTEGHSQNLTLCLTSGQR